VERAETYDCTAAQVRARPARNGEVVDCDAIGRVLTHPGEWVVEVPTIGSRLVMSSSAFEALFKPSDS
jgi:hypothetical protein